MFDKRKDFGTISGAGDARFYQAGKYYDIKHNEVTESGELVKGGAAPVPAPAPEVTPETPDTDVTTPDAPTEDAAPDTNVTEEAPEVPLDENGQVDDVDLEALSWREIKKMVESAGGNWVDKAEGITYLRSL